MDTHPPAPKAINPDYRPGLGAALIKAYTAWSNAHPGHSRAEGRAEHRRLVLELTPKYPTIKELKEQ